MSTDPNPGARIQPPRDETCLGCGASVAQCDAAWQRAGSPIPGDSSADELLRLTCACPPLREAVRGLEHTLGLMQTRINNNDVEIESLRHDLANLRALTYGSVEDERILDAAERARNTRGGISIHDEKAPFKAEPKP